MEKEGRYQKVLEQLSAQPSGWVVTGAAGFIGSHLVETLLKAGQNVAGLDNFATGYRENLDDIRARVGSAAWERFVFIEGDIAEPDDCARAVSGADYVLHQAALGSVPRSIENPAASHRANVDGFLNMLLAARDAAVKCFVYASSSAVYGDSPELPKVEGRIGEALSPYAVTKRINELYAENFTLVYGMKTAGLRYFNVFGPRQDPNGAYAAVIPRWIAELVEGRRCTIYGDGETSRDFCYIDNVVQANILAAVSGGASACPAAATFNVAAGARTTLNELYAALVSALSQETGREFPGPAYEEFRKGDVRHSLADIGKIDHSLGYVPTHSLSDGIPPTVAWFLKPDSSSAGGSPGASGNGFGTYRR